MKPETLGEINIMFQNLDTKMDDIIQAVKENTDITKQLETRVSITNGQIVELKRVNKEDVIPIVSDYKENRARIRGMITTVTIGGSILIAGICLLFKLYMDKKEQDITNGVIQKLETKYNIEIYEENT